MKPPFFSRFGGPEVSQYRGPARPGPRPRGSLVDIHAASVNAADWKMRAGSIPKPSRFRMSRAGTFQAWCRARARGRRTQGRRPRCSGVRSAARRRLRPKRSRSGRRFSREAASLTPRANALRSARRPHGAVSSRDTLKLKAGETILIHGGAGGVGASPSRSPHLGARVVTTARRGDTPYVRSSARTSDRLPHAGLHQARFRLRCGLRHGGETSRSRIFASFVRRALGDHRLTARAFRPAPRSPTSTSLRPKVDADRPAISDRAFARWSCKGVFPLPAKSSSIRSPRRGAHR